MPNITVETKPCIFCHKTHAITMDEEQYAGYIRWMSREGHIQNMIPRMGADDREMLMTGIDPECWDKIFPEEDEEEVDEYGPQSEGQE